MNRKSKDRNVVLEKPRRLEDAPQRFDTPSWLASRPATDQDAPSQAAPGSATAKAPAGIPQQAAPVHDNAATMARTGIPREARWKARHKVRTFFALLMVPLLAAAVGGGYYAWSIGSMEYIPVAAIPALVVVGIWGAMINTPPVVTTLKGSRVSVRHDGTTDEFDLANPDQAVETPRDARDPKWRVTLERVDGSQLVLTRKHVPPADFMKIVQLYRRIAAEQLEQRIRRYQA
ncbi:MAG TPA: hypothetical protein VI452_07090 [Marmoricola sp.]